MPKLPENDESKYIKTLAKMQGTSSHGCTKYCLDRFAGSSSLFHIPEWPLLLTQLSADAKPSGLMATVSQKAYQGKPSLEIFGVSGEMAMKECGCMGLWVGGWTNQITHSIPEFRTWHSENVKIGWRQEHHQRLPLLLAV